MEEIFDIEKFNVISDEENYYFFRSLEPGDIKDLEEGNSILEQLGFSYRNYQEKQRATYSIDGVEVDIDTWPLIPTYAEIENDSEELIRAIINKLGLQNHEIKSCNAAKVCEKYGIDLYKYRTLKFDEKETNVE